MKPRTGWTFLRGLPALAALFVQGCVDGDLNRRDDGRMASEMQRRRVSPIYEENLRAEAERLRTQNPGISREDALAQARKTVPREYLDTTHPTREELEKKRAQDAFEEELAELKE